MKQGIFMVDRKKETIKRLYSTAIILFILFLALSFFVVRQPEWIQTFDRSILLYLDSIRSNELNALFLAITSLANRNTQIFFTIGVMIILFLFKRFKVGLWYGLTELFGAEFFNDFVKNVFERPRPDFVEHLVSESSFAFPSGHAMGAMIMYGGVAFIISQLLSLQNEVRRILFIIVGIIIFAVGFSRLYLGVHYPTDVVGGFLLGGAWLSLAIAIYYQFIATNTRRRLI